MGRIIYNNEEAEKRIKQAINVDSKTFLLIYK